MFFDMINATASNVEYELLPFQFGLLTICGAWHPTDWPSYKRFLHSAYFRTLIALDALLCIEMMIYFILSIGTEAFALTDFFFVSASISGVYKLARIGYRREALRSFIRRYFDYRWMKPGDEVEELIHVEYNIKIRNVAIVYFISMVSIILFKDLPPLLEATEGFPMPVAAWYPYSLERASIFWITYVHQLIVGTCVAVAHVCTDTLFVGLLLKTLCQLSILKYRCKNVLNMFNEKRFIEFKTNTSLQKRIVYRFIHHHARIYRFGEDLNSRFQEQLFILVISSLPNICINVYALSSSVDQIDVNYIATFFCTTSALLQFFITCWYGNEVAVNSVDVKNALYEMDWSMFDISVQKLLMIMMGRALKPITFTVGYIIPMNVDSFLKILKASYSAFNLLQQTSS